MKPSLQLRLGQTLTMTPQLQQAIRLLQLPIVELQEQIQEALESNVMLEADEEETGVQQDAEQENRVEQQEREGDRKEQERDQDSETTYEEQWERPLTAAESQWNNSSEPRITQEFADPSGETLQDHLLWQLEMEHLDQTEHAIGRAIIDAINDDGYLIDDLATIRETLGAGDRVSIDQIEVVLGKIQRLDPAGIGARSISESLDIQLRQLAEDTPGRELARSLASDHLELIAENRYGALRRRLHVSEDELETAIALVRAMHPRPGSAINSVPPEYVVPDVYVRKLDNRWLVELNSSLSPSLRVNQAYASHIARGGEHSMLRTQLQEARWLVRSLEIRNETLFKVASCIVERQHAFLEQGDEAMTPMVLRDIAEALEMHESTISRVTTNKYMHTPRGVFEFRYFFSSHIGTHDGNELSSVAIRAMIKKLIGSENAGKPLSDNKIASMLSDNGISVARRTVAKYRESMSIPSSSERKRLAKRH